MRADWGLSGWSFLQAELFTSIPWRHQFSVASAALSFPDALWGTTPQLPALGRNLGRSFGSRDQLVLPSLSELEDALEISDNDWPPGAFLRDKRDKVQPHEASEVTRLVTAELGGGSGMSFPKVAVLNLRGTVESPAEVLNVHIPRPHSRPFNQKVSEVGPRH